MANEMIIFFPDSPNTPVKVTRGGRDPIFNEEQGPQHVNLTWQEDEHYQEEEAYLDDEGVEQVHYVTKVRQVTRGTSFKGPMV